jgi:hypothetical protein
LALLLTKDVVWNSPLPVSTPVAEFQSQVAVDPVAFASDQAPPVVPGLVLRQGLAAPVGAQVAHFRVLNTPLLLR